MVCFCPATDLDSECAVQCMMIYNKSHRRPTALLCRKRRAVQAKWRCIDTRRCADTHEGHYMCKGQQQQKPSGCWARECYRGSLCGGGVAAWWPLGCKACCSKSAPRLRTGAVDVCGGTNVWFAMEEVLRTITRRGAGPLRGASGAHGD